MPGITRRLELLEAQLPPANGHNGNGHSHEPVEYWTMEAICEQFHFNHLRFEGPAQVVVGPAFGPLSPGYEGLAEIAQMISDSMQKSGEPPGNCMFVPLTAEQVDLAQRALDAGLLVIEESWGYGHIKHFCTQIGAPWSVCDRRNSQCYSFPGLEGKPFDIHGLAQAVDRALDAAIIQLGMDNSPPGISKTLEFAGDILEWHRFHHPNSLEDGEA